MLTTARGTAVNNYVSGIGKKLLLLRLRTNNHGITLFRLYVFLAPLRCIISSAVVESTLLACNTTLNFSRFNARLRLVAGMAGVEPANMGTKIPCLTSWRHPYVL